MGVERYHYIVIGGGSAGCVLANRLSRDPQHRVLLLEAGPSDKTPLARIPGAAQELILSDKYEWKLKSIPQAALNNRQLNVFRGKMLGGSSGLNGMVYIRGHARDYDRWAEHNPGWSYAEVLPFFKKSENNVRDPNHFHAQGGELDVIDSPSTQEVYDLFVDACEQSAIVRNPDFNGEQQYGCGRYQATITPRRVRSSSAYAFLRDARRRKNLDIITGAEVQRILLDDKIAVGVEYRKKGATVRAYADSEIILSAGAIKSPQILQLSGIGRATDLQRVGIHVQHSLDGVGYNLQEHLDSWMHYTTRNVYTVNRASRSIYSRFKTALQYLFKRDGVASWCNIEGGAFVYSSKRTDIDHPDIQIHLTGGLIYNLAEPPPKRDGITVHACNLRPQSRGSVLLQSADPQAPPLIDFNFLDNAADRKVMIEGVRWVRKIMQTAVWQNIIIDEANPGSHCQSDEQILDFIRQKADIVYHPVGTCKMGPKDDPQAVVDAQLRVHGIQKLRVADASIMPTIVSGNTNAPSMMIGEKAAAMIVDK